MATSSIRRTSLMKFDSKPAPLRSKGAAPKLVSAANVCASGPLMIVLRLGPHHTPATRGTYVSNLAEVCHSH